LDLTIYKGPRHARSGTLDFKPFFKKTNKFQYLEYSSAHPRGTFSSLVKGELTRLLRACSDEEIYKSISNKILNAFRDRGYPNSILQRTLQQVPFPNRTQLLEKKKGDVTKPDTFLKVNYTPDLNVKAIREILKPTSEEINKVPIPCLSLTKADNIAKKLVRAKLKQYPNPPTSTDPITINPTKYNKGNSIPCEKPGCQCCTVISKKYRVTSTYNNKTFPTQKYTCCSTRNTVYLLECTKCTKYNQYIGCTSDTLNARLATHMENSTTRTNFPLYKHFLQKPDHNFERDTKITILKTTTRTRLPKEEDLWIKRMDTIYPKGLNYQLNN
jgi:hypothetical protein